MVEQAVSQLYEDMQARSLIPLWRIEEATLPLHPKPTLVALGKYREQDYTKHGGH